MFFILTQCDSPALWQIYVSDPASITMEGILTLTNELKFYEKSFFLFNFFKKILIVLGYTLVYTVVTVYYFLTVFLWYRYIKVNLNLIAFCWR